MFQKAERKQSKLRLAITGASGSGKTTAALNIATGIGGRIAVLDTENGSASLYADQFDFDVVNLVAPYTPERFIEVITTAEKAGYDILIIDSTTHEWSGKGGCLEINDSLAASRFKGNTWSAWSETTPRHRAFIDAMLRANMHIIATMRSKTETVQGEGKKIMKLGMKSEQRDGVEYEFTTVLDLMHETHLATATKDRTRLFAGQDPQRINKDTGALLRDWLNSGKADKTISPEQRDTLQDMMADAEIDVATFCQKRGLESLLEVRESVFDETVQALRQRIANRKQAAAAVNDPEVH
ncbi:MAG: ATP-binding protein [Flavobacteriales bacterium]